MNAAKAYEEFGNEKGSFPGLAAVKTLIKFIVEDKCMASVAPIKCVFNIFSNFTATTLSEFFKNLNAIEEELKNYEPLMQVDSYMAIFKLFVTLHLSEYDVCTFHILSFLFHSSCFSFQRQMEKAKEVLKMRGNLFLDQAINCKAKTAKIGQPFISDGSEILVNSWSSIVFETLLEAKNKNKRFTVYVTESHDSRGKKMWNQLRHQNIDCTSISDSAIGYYMEKVDVVLSGAEGVVENGGIINTIGTYPLALCAKAMNKPFYVLVESFKFTRFYPLNQRDIPDRFKFKKGTAQRPVIDYTPPALITLLLTNLGALTTAAVSDVLMQLYL
ncbi:translation initiation factor eIF-2B subunit alpha-like protein [Dinothrombium tinctorium]|uniref:Translation initiation factor eIF2B subunit alpha n=1 Tax=Dinothrombium tinctorium TaxID=1965070 RepID=A0A443QMV5_9ACAR|nr:translation initiation factor eIF-2B subunit alpha-like protein [Dinothrombium tinctorium]